MEALIKHLYPNAKTFRNLEEEARDLYGLCCFRPQGPVWKTILSDWINTYHGPGLYKKTAYGPVGEFSEVDLSIDKTPYDLVLYRKRSWVNRSANEREDHSYGEVLEVAMLFSDALQKKAGASCELCKIALSCSICREAIEQKSKFQGFHFPGNPAPLGQLVKKENGGVSFVIFSPKPE